MQIAIGFLAATFLALALLPAINRRAERLARRRMQALFPLSLAELNAEKDHLRAEFAIEQRRLERALEQVQAGKAADMAELGLRAGAIARLEEAVAAHLATIAARDAALEAERASLAERTSERNAAREDAARLEVARRRAGRA